jgi:hypothetical protein
VDLGISKGLDAVFSNFFTKIEKLIYINFLPVSSPFRRFFGAIEYGYCMFSSDSVGILLGNFKDEI